MSGLAHSTVDVPILSLNQTPPDHAGPNGRLTEAVNVIADRFVPGDGYGTNGGARLKIKPRNAFVSLSTQGSDPVTGGAVSVPWALPELASTLGQQLLSICSAQPRVWNGSTWTAYTDRRILTNQLQSTVVHTGNHVLQAPTSAWAQGVTCSVWVELVPFSLGTVTTTLYIGFRADNGAWIVPPRVLFQPGSNISNSQCLARVRTDGDRFWVVFNAQNGIDDDQCLNVLLFDLAGQLLYTVLYAQFVDDESVGFWDIIITSDGKMQLVQPGDYPDGTTDVHCEISTWTWNGSALSFVADTDVSISCTGPCAWATNDLESGQVLAYLLTHVNNDGVFGYQILDRARLHEYEFGGTEDEPDSLIGWVKTGLATDQPVMYAGWSILATEQSTGPAFDPGLRFSEVYKCTWAGTGTKERQNNSVVFVSRAFAVDGEYYACTYYQSGTGVTQTAETENVDWTAGDYMTGAPTQPIDVQNFDRAAGSPQSFFSPSSGNNIDVVNGAAPEDIDGTGTPDSVQAYISGGMPEAPAGTPILKWTFKDLASGVDVYGAFLRVTGSSIPSADGDWLILNPGEQGPNHIYYTSRTSVAGNGVIPGNFTGSGGSGGTVEIVPMVAYVIPGLQDVYNEETARQIWGQDMDVSGNALDPVNNGTKTIVRIVLNPNGGGFTISKYTTSTVWVNYTAEVSDGTSFSSVLHGDQDNEWHFADGGFTDVLFEQSHFLTLSGASRSVNNTSLPIADVTDADTLETDPFSEPEVFHPPLITASIDLGLGVQPYTFKLQTLTLDFTYIGALVVVTDAANDQNNGTYEIIQIVSSDTFIAKPVNGQTGQRSESFASDVLISIFFANGLTSAWQSTWFITPLVREIHQAHVGRFDSPLAYADWRIEGDASLPPNMFLLGVTDVVETDAGLRFTLPYRAESFTASAPLVTASGQVVPEVSAIAVNTVGLKMFDLLNKNGQAQIQSDELLLPGPMASKFTASGFTEDGVNVGFERPFVVSQSEVSDTLHLTPGTTLIYTVVAEVWDENGDRIYSVPSPSMQTTLVGDANSVVLAGRMMQPLDPLGSPFSHIYGLTNHRLVGISIYRTAYRNGIPSTQRFKITSDLSVNGLTPVTPTNNSGFTFTDDFTWEYIDRNPDSAVLNGEILYTDKGFLPRFPAPAFSHGCTWKDRSWVIAPDGSLWFSAERVEGDAAWFFPGFRYDFGGLRCVQVQPNDDYLIVFTDDDGIWWIPAPQSFPDGAGRNGNMPAPVKTVFKNGCTGFACPIRTGVAYAAKSGGIWLLRRDLANVWISSPAQLSLDQDQTGFSITGMGVDKFQRLHISTDAQSWFVYDQITDCWYRWQIPGTNAAQMAIWNGHPVFQNGARMAVYTPGAHLDVLGNNESHIAPDITLSNLEFYNVRGLKCIWEFQAIGEYKGPHQLNAVISYPDDENSPDTIRGPFTPDPDKPYVIPFNPDPEESASFSIRLYATFDGIEEPGDSFELEMISAEVGLDRKSGIAKQTNSQRMV